MDLYRAQILDHNKHPHNFGHLTHADSSVTLFNSACGDKITMDVIFEKTKNSVSDVRFSGEGCAISQASASLLTDMVKGMKKEDVMHMNTETVLKLLHTTLTPSRIKCATLPLEALQKCIVE